MLVSFDWCVSGWLEEGSKSVSGSEVGVTRVEVELRIAEAEKEDFSIRLRGEVGVSTGDAATNQSIQVSGMPIKSTMIW